ncbi:hypothetical protein C8Q74DRAFT_1191408 [Fomes fomentarius]|nr:hypothetical protein C8Q74DRAFT_1191408 [Fomes fomentarius]
MASHLLSQSLSALPDLSTTAASLGVGKDVKGKARAVSSTYPNGSATSGDAGGDKEKGVRDEGQKEEEKPLAPRAHNTRLATGALSTPPNTYKERGLRGEGSAESKGKAKDNGEGELGGSGSPAVGALAVLRDCRIFVDVRTDEGDDAGGLFVDMLRGMGAKIANRVGSRCTHVVFKNGLMSTISRYKSMDPKPHVVGIAWVVECVEQRIKVDESRFTVNLQHMNVAGVNKVRLPCRLVLSEGSNSRASLDHALMSHLHRDASRCCQSIIPPWRTRSQYHPLCLTRRVEARLFPAWVSEPTVLRGSLLAGGVRLKRVGRLPIRRVSVFRFFLVCFALFLRVCGHGAMVVDC